MPRNKTRGTSACLCGCGDTPALATSRYRQGHDAKHRGELHRAVLAGEITEEQARAELPSVALADQLSDGLTRARG